MHLQQTKAGSRKTGGPQYYFHDLTEPIKHYLRQKGACPVVLQTPYGIAESPFVAVGRDHKLLPNGRVVSGRVGHDRVQQSTGADESIGEAIRYWYDLTRGRDFERIDVDVRIDKEGLPRLQVPNGTLQAPPEGRGFLRQGQPAKCPRAC